MTENEDILDSGQIPDSEHEHMTYLPELDLSEKRFDTIEWKSINKGGASFKTHDAVTLDSSIFRFEAARNAKLFGLIFFIPVLAFTIFPILAIIHQVPVWNVLSVFFFLALFFMILTIYQSITAPSIFDKDLDLFWKQRPTLFKLLHPKGNFVVDLDDIKAIQLIRQYIKGKNRAYYSYEINLVLDNNQRLNVVDHGEGKQALEQAKSLAEFLEVPLLNGTERN